MVDFIKRKFKKDFSFNEALANLDTDIFVIHIAENDEEHTIQRLWFEVDGKVSCIQLRDLDDDPAAARLDRDLLNCFDIIRIIRAVTPVGKLGFEDFEIVEESWSDSEEVFNSEEVDYLVW